jgi:hypothetical protein
MIAFYFENAVNLEGLAPELVINYGSESHFNFTPAPRGELCPLEEMFTPTFTPRGEHSVLFRRMDGLTEKFTPRG